MKFAESRTPLRDILHLGLKYHRRRVKDAT